MIKMIIPVRGMHCRSCEILIEDNLSKISSVEHAKVSHKKGIAEVYYLKSRPDMRQIEDAVREAGYSIGQPEKKSFVTKNPSDYKDLGIAFLFLAGIYIVLKNFGVLNLNIAGAASEPSSLPVIFLVGLTAGFSTCMALVGGLVLGVSGRHAEKHPEATATQKFRPHIFFNAGRIVSYAVLGGVLGYLGSVFQISNSALGLLTIAVGMVMLILGLQLTEMFPRLSGWKFTLPKSLSRIMGVKNHEKEYSHRGSFILGAMTFFLPCGFTQAMQLYAISTGSFVAGGLVMGVFALGTAPGILGIGGLTSMVKGIFAKRFFKLAGIVVVFLALFNMSNGYRLTGWNVNAAALWGNSGDNKIAAAGAVGDPNVKLENGVQVVKMTESSRGYTPNKFTIKKGIPVKWVIDAKDPYSCASSLTMQKYGIRKNLKAGENVIEFTPKETGRVPFMCSMGMYTGYFNVVDENDSSVVTAAQDDSSNVPQGGGGCGGGAAKSGSAQPSCGGGGGGCGGCGGGKKYQPSEGTVAEDKVSESASSAENSGAAKQIIKTVYTYDDDIQPNTFTVKAGAPVKIIVEAKEDGLGCMSTIMIPGLYDTPEYLEKGQNIIMEFTPQKKGSYPITCAMGVPRGVLKVI